MVPIFLVGAGYRIQVLMLKQQEGQPFTELSTQLLESTLHETKGKKNPILYLTRTAANLVLVLIAQMVTH